MFDNLSGFFATQSKDGNSTDRTLSVQRNDEDFASKSESKVEAKGTASQNTAVLTQTRKAVQAASASLSDNNVTEKKEQGEVAQKKTGKDMKEIRATLDDLNARLESHELNARFTVDEESSRFVVQLVDSSGQVIRQIPSEDSLEFARNAEKGVGVLVDKDL